MPLPTKQENCPVMSEVMGGTEGSIDPVKVEKWICCDDERLNYTFIKPEQIENHMPVIPQILASEKFDYSVVIKKGDPETADSVGTLDEVVPLSYAQIKDANCGEEWYRAKYPELPEEFYGIIARYTWGQPFTKKEIKQTAKKMKKKPKKTTPQGFSMVKGTFELDFD